FDRAGEHHKRLALPVDVPLWTRSVLRHRQPLTDAIEFLLPPRLILRPLVVRLPEPLRLPPVPQQPFGRPVQPRIFRRPVQLLQPLHAPVPLARRKRLLAELPQAQHEGTANRHVRFGVQALDYGPDVGTERAEAVDEVAPRPGVGTVLEHGPNRFRLA